MDSKRRVLSTIVLDLIFVFCFFITATVAASGCFLVEKNSGKCVGGGEHNLFSISQGQTFHLAISTMLFAFHSMWSFKLLRDSGHPNPFVFGVLLGTYGLVSLTALSNSAVWGSYSSSVSSLNCTGDLPQAPNGVLLKCNGFNAAFSALSVLSSLIFICNGAVTTMLYVWQREFVGDVSSLAPSGGIGGGRREEGGEVYESMTANSTAEGHTFFHSTPPTQSHFEQFSSSAVSQSDAEESFLPPS